MGTLAWIDDWFPSVDGIRAKAVREEITEKNWVTIHGHPVNIGGGSGSGSGGGGGHGGSAKPGTSGAGGTATDGDFGTSQHASPGTSLQTWKHGLIDTPGGKDIHVRFQPRAKFLGGKEDRIAFEGPGGLSGSGKTDKYNLRPARAYTRDEHVHVDTGIQQRIAESNIHQAGYSAPPGSSMKK